MSKLVVVIQCDIVTKRCSGYACMNTFVNRKDTFADYPPDTRFLMMTCGGCCGAGLSAKLENLAKKLKKYGDAGYLAAHEDVFVFLPGKILRNYADIRGCRITA